MAEPYLSIVIPAYNEEARLPGTLEKIAGFLAAQTYPAEVIVVENGSHDRTLAIAQDFGRQNGVFRAMHVDGRGKGLAVRAGMLAARGAYRFMCDADLSMTIEQVNHFLPPKLDHYDIAIASREAPGAVRYNEPAYRHLGGRLVNTMIRVLILPGLHDTQCGFKCFRAAVAEDLFASQVMTGWSFDVELLYVARKRGYRVVEVPVDWYFSSESKVNAIQDALRMAKDILAIHHNGWRGLYDRAANQDGAKV